ncbi:MAG: hypothetical protein RL417_1816, partial [Pseudomonadota bacterium]
MARVGFRTDLEIGSFTAGQQRKIENLLAELRTLSEIERAYPEVQRDFYGERRWRGEFTPLAELEVAPGTRLSGEALQRVVWGALPDGPFKRFQELFVEPAQ